MPSCFIIYYISGGFFIILCLFAEVFLKLKENRNLREQQLGSQGIGEAIFNYSFFCPPEQFCRILPPQKQVSVYLSFNL